MCDFSRVSAWFCDEKISLKKSCFYLYIRRLYGRDLCAGSFRCDHRCDRAGAVLEIHAEKLRETQKERSCEQQD